MKKLAALLAVLFVASTLSYAVVEAPKADAGMSKTKVVKVKRVKKMSKIVKVEDKTVAPVKK
jgi:hypothetical protein